MQRIREAVVRGPERFGPHDAPEGNARARKRRLERARKLARGLDRLDAEEALLGAPGALVREAEVERNARGGVDRHVRLADVREDVAVAQPPRVRVRHDVAGRGAGEVAARAAVARSDRSEEPHGAPVLHGDDRRRAVRVRVVLPRPFGLARGRAERGLGQGEEKRPVGRFGGADLDGHRAENTSCP